MHAHYNGVMRIRTVLLLLLLAAGIGCWQAETRAALAQRLWLRSLAVQLQPFGSLSYGDTRAHFWGSGEVQTLRYVPAPAWLAARGLPADLALEIPLLRYRDWQAEDGWPHRMRLTFAEARLNLPAPWPQQASGSLDWHYQPADRDLRLALSLDAPAAAAIEARLGLQLQAARQWRGAALLDGQLQYRDQGLAQGERAALALALGADPQNADAALAARLAAWLSARGLPPTPAFSAALLAFAREPLAATLTLDPPGTPRPESLPLFAPADRMTALGLQLALPAGGPP